MAAGLKWLLSTTPLLCLGDRNGARIIPWEVGPDRHGTIGKSKALATLAVSAVHHDTGVASARIDTAGTLKGRWPTTRLELVVLMRMGFMMKD